jgi:hypothetical protein
MGQFRNQPDFGTSAKEINSSNDITKDTTLNGACIYVGNGGSLKVILTGVTAPDGRSKPTEADAVTFENMADGSFLPVIVDYVISDGTTAGALIAIK